MILFYMHHPSPIGPLLLTAGAQGLNGLYMEADKHGPRAIPPEWTHKPAHFTDRLNDLPGQLDQYFAGHRQDFDVPFLLEGTPFQKAVWQALCAIPYGQTISYGTLARRIGNPKAVRAVGLANGRNPVSIIVPCHRVIGADGSLTGYGGGLARKIFLLDLEKNPSSLP